jgi:hypothetical protein
METLAHVRDAMTTAKEAMKSGDIGRCEAMLIVKELEDAAYTLEAAMDDPSYPKGQYHE